MSRPSASFNLHNPEEIEKAYELLIELKASKHPAEKMLAHTLQGVIPAFEKLLDYTPEMQQANRDDFLHAMRGTGAGLTSGIISLMSCFNAKDGEAQFLMLCALLDDMQHVLSVHSETKDAGRHLKAAMGMLEPVRQACKIMLDARRGAGR